MLNALLMCLMSWESVTSDSSALYRVTTMDDAYAMAIAIMHSVTVGPMTVQRMMSVNVPHPNMWVLLVGFFYLCVHLYFFFFTVLESNQRQLLASPQCCSLWNHRMSGIMAWDDSCCD